MFFLMYEKDAEGKNRDVRVDKFPVASGGLRALHGAAPAQHGSAQPAFGCRRLRPGTCCAAALALLSHRTCFAVHTHFLRPAPLCIATELLNELMGLLRQHVLANPVLRKKLFQVGSKMGMMGCALVGLSACGERVCLVGARLAVARLGRLAWQCGCSAWAPTLGSGC